jgi:hypothetical protein
MSFAISVQRARRVRVGLKPAFVKTAIRYLPGKSKTLGLCAQVAPNDEFMAPARVLGVDIAANAPMVVRSAGDGCARTWAWAWAWAVGVAQQFNDHVHHIYMYFVQLMSTEDAQG